MSPDEQQKNKKSGKKLIGKRFDAELGAVSPCIFVPGEWTTKELAHHAEALLANKLLNSGCICASPQVIVVDKDWPQRKEFNEILRKKMKEARPQPPFYPGSVEKCLKVKDSYKQAEVYTKLDSLPLVYVPDAQPDSIIGQQEVFGPMFAEIPLDTKGDPAAFLKKAVEYSNDVVYGSLSCSLFIDPRTEARYKKELEEAIANLEWGTIGINDWAASSIFHGQSVWGAFPGHDSTDIQSGVGKILNSRLYTNVQKTVLRSPFFTPGHSTLPDDAAPKKQSRIAWYVVSPSTWRLVSVLSAALLGW
jgi:acyl-CoA reductase-like NAD-dependent aldehyde dehydrogenase